MKSNISLNSQPLVSVIMPVYNGEKFLHESIESILNQTYKNFEFIIIDDASTDNSLSIIKDFQKKDKRIKVFENKKNKGTFKNYNFIFNLAKGDYIAIQEQDDISIEERLFQQISFLVKNKDIVVVGSNILIINDENRIIGKRIYPNNYREIKNIILFKSPFANPSVIMRKKIIIENKGYGCYMAAGDYDLWMRLILEKEYKTANINEFLIKYRIHNNQLKYERTKQQLKETLMIQRKYLFNKKYFSFLALLNHLLLNILYFLPSNFILWLFKKYEFKNKN